MAGFDHTYEHAVLTYALVHQQPVSQAASQPANLAAAATRHRGPSRPTGCSLTAGWFEQRVTRGLLLLLPRRPWKHITTGPNAAAATAPIDCRADRIDGCRVGSIQTHSVGDISLKLY
jgi:hypothetical protein